MYRRYRLPLASNKFYRHEWLQWLPSRLQRGTRSALLPLGLKLSTSSKHRRNGRRFSAVAVILLLWAWVCALEVSPELHHFLHKDAQSPAHNCLVTQLQHHGTHPGSAPAIVALPPTGWNALITREHFFLPASFD